MSPATPVIADSAAPEATSMPAPQMLGLRAVLIILALIEAGLGLSDAPTLFGDMSHIGSGIGAGLVKAHLAAPPARAPPPPPHPPA
ncbi:MAG TPA: hypothetical protein DCR50_09200, partial [Afipia sp.]|nr:hypothetical protein [Afipia sp.]